MIIHSQFLHTLRANRSKIKKMICLPPSFYILFIPSLAIYVYLQVNCHKSNNMSLRLRVGDCLWDLSHFSSWGMVMSLMPPPSLSSLAFIYLFCSRLGGRHTLAEIFYVPPILLVRIYFFLFMYSPGFEPHPVSRQASIFFAMRSWWQGFFFVFFYLFFRRVCFSSNICVPA